MASSTGAAQFIKALTRIVWRVVGRRTSLGSSPRHRRGEPGARPLTLITLAGEELPLEVDPAGHASLRSFENAVLERLSHQGNTTTLVTHQESGRAPARPGHIKVLFTLHNWLKLPSVKQAGD